MKTIYSQLTPMGMLFHNNIDISTMTKKEKEERCSYRQRSIDSLLRSMKEDTIPEDADEVTRGWFLDMLFDNAAGVARLEKEQEEEK